MSAYLPSLSKNEYTHMHTRLYLSTTLHLVWLSDHLIPDRPANCHLQSHQSFKPLLGCNYLKVFRRNEYMPRMFEKVHLQSGNGLDWIPVIQITHSFKNRISCMSFGENIWLTCLSKVIRIKLSRRKKKQVTLAMTSWPLNRNPSFT